MKIESEIIPLNEIAEKVSVQNTCKLVNCIVEKDDYFLSQGKVYNILKTINGKYGFRWDKLLNDSSRIIYCQFFDEQQVQLLCKQKNNKHKVDEKSYEESAAIVCLYFDLKKPRNLLMNAFHISMKLINKYYYSKVHEKSLEVKNYIFHPESHYKFMQACNQFEKDLKIKIKFELMTTKEDFKRAVDQSKDIVRAYSELLSHIDISILEKQLKLDTNSRNWIKNWVHQNKVSNNAVEVIEKYLLTDSKDRDIALCYVDLPKKTKRSKENQMDDGNTDIIGLSLQDDPEIKASVMVTSDDGYDNLEQILLFGSFPVWQIKSKHLVNGSDSAQGGHHTSTKFLLSEADNIEMKALPQGGNFTSSYEDINFKISKNETGELQVQDSSTDFDAIQVGYNTCAAIEAWTLQIFSGNRSDNFEEVNDTLSKILCSQDKALDYYPIDLADLYFPHAWDFDGHDSINKPTVKYTLDSDSEGVKFEEDLIEQEQLSLESSNNQQLKWYRWQNYTLYLQYFAIQHYVSSELEESWEEKQVYLFCDNSKESYGAQIVKQLSRWVNQIEFMQLLNSEHLLQGENKNTDANFFLQVKVGYSKGVALASYVEHTYQET